MIAAEAAGEEGIKVVPIATPNNTRYAIARAALEAGRHAICEKPMCFTTGEAEELRALAQSNGRVIGLAYGCSCYQMIDEVRALVAAGALGKVRLVNRQFAHGFLSAPVEEEDPAIRRRVDPRFAGPSYVLGDLATHPLYLSEVICPELRIRRLMCVRQSFVASRAPLEDNAVPLMEYEDGAFGTVWTSAVNAGAMHSQKLRIVGERASIEWWDEFPNQLRYEVQGEPPRILDRGMGYLSAPALADDRIGGGHPEGIFESWATMYERFARAIEAANAGRAPDPGLRYPDAAAGGRALRADEGARRGRGGRSAGRSSFNTVSQ